MRSGRRHVYKKKRTGDPLSPATIQRQTTEGKNLKQNNFKLVSGSSNSTERGDEKDEPPNVALDAFFFVLGMHL